MRFSTLGGSRVAAHGDGRDGGGRSVGGSNDDDGNSGNGGGQAWGYLFSTEGVLGVALSPKGALTAPTAQGTTERGKERFFVSLFSL